MRNSIKISLIFSNLIIIYILYYIIYFPVIINNYISDLLLIFVISLLIFIIIYNIYSNQSNIVTTLFAIPASLLIFISRALPNLRLTAPPFHDPYFYAVTTMNIVDFGTLNPTYVGWYGLIEQQLWWPLYHLLSADLLIIGNYNLIFNLRFLSPFISLIFFFALFVLARKFLKNTHVSFIAALLGSMSEVIIFYQSEYHPQGLSLILFIFFILLIVMGMEKRTPSISITLLLIIFGLILSHHFSSIYLGLISLTLLIPILLIKINFNLLHFNAASSSISTVLLITCTAAFAYHIYAYPSLLIQFSEMLLNNTPSGSLITYGKDVPQIVTILNAIKWIPLILSLIGIFIAIRDKNEKAIVLSYICGAFVLSGVIGIFIVSSPTDRILAFVMPLASILAVYCLISFSNNNHKNKNILTILIIVIITIPISTGFFNSQIPAFYFHNTDQDSYYWYSNNLPNMDEQVSVGGWVKQQVSTNTSTFAITFDTRIIPFYYGEKPLDNLKSINYINSSYYIFYPSNSDCYGYNNLNQSTIYDCNLKINIT